MKHARSDYDRIQDPAGLIPADEPVFLLRAQDMLAPETVEFWAEIADTRTGAAPDIIRAAYRQVDAMRKWQRLHGKKVPDLPRPASDEQECPMCKGKGGWIGDRPQDEADCDYCEGTGRIRPTTETE